MDDKGTTAIIEAIGLQERTLVALASAVNTIIARLSSVVGSLIAAATTHFTHSLGVRPDFPATPTEAPILAIHTVPNSHRSSQGPLETPVRSVNDVLSRKPRGSEEEKTVTKTVSKEACQTVYLEHYATNGESLKAYSKQDRCRIGLTMTWFDSISTVQEKVTLRDTSVELGKRKALTARLSGLLELRLANLWRDLEMPLGKMPKALEQNPQRSSRLEVNALDNIICHKFPSTNMGGILSSLSSWRSTHEAASSHNKKA